MTNSADRRNRKSSEKYGSFDFYTCDAIALKPLKGQPSIVVLEKELLNKSSSQRHRRSKTINSPEV
jgi:hypothetical protein